jgi:rhodanese-related sulfurtransferase
MLQNIKNMLEHRITFFALSLIMLAVYSAHLDAADAPNLTRAKIVVPEKIPGVETLNAEQLIEILTSDKPPILIDARIRSDRVHGYIESSIGLPDIETNCDALSKITTDKSSHLTFYCNGVQCGRSVVSIKIARSCGFHNLSWFKGGFSEWNEKGYQYIKPR